MSKLVVVHEDLIQAVILRRLLGEYDAHWINAEGKSKIDKRTPSYIRAAAHDKVIVMRDLDRDADCAPTFLRLRELTSVPSNFVYRLPIRTVETWVMADKEAFCNYFRSSYQHLQGRNLESEHLPKQLLLKLVWNGGLSRSKKDTLVRKVGNEYRQKYGYNSETVTFIEHYWDLDIAMSNSESLRRCKDAIDTLLQS